MSNGDPNPDPNPDRCFAAVEVLRYFVRNGPLAALNDERSWNEVRTEVENMAVEQLQSGGPLSDIIASFSIGDVKPGVEQVELPIKSRGEWKSVELVLEFLQAFSSAQEYRIKIGTLEDTNACATLLSTKGPKELPDQ